NTLYGGGLAPVWSPSGSTIAFTGGSSCSSGIFVVDAGSGELRRVTGKSQLGRQPAWSPDSLKLAYVGHPLPCGTGISTLYVIDADGRHQRPLTHDRDRPVLWSPVWSPDGKQIAFEHYRRGGDVEIDVINADGTGRRRLA